MKGKRSPWGTIQYAREIAAGIVLIDTAGHGGIKLDRTRNAAVPRPLRAEGGWYEEDCQENIPHFFFYDEFTAYILQRGHCIPVEGRDAVENHIKEWFPHEWMAWKGVTLDPSESHVLRREKFEEETRGKYVARTTWGDWHKQVPEGYVGVYAVRKADGAAKWVLVKKNKFVVQDRRYACREFFYVLDDDDVEWLQHPA